MSIGEKIKSLRIQHNLTQEDLAKRTELSKGFISQLERDLTSPSIASLIDILTCLGTDLHHFFSEASDKQVVFNQSDYFENRHNESKHMVQWLVPNAQKNTMEPIKVIIEGKGSTTPDLPHDGEEFGYVLKGSVILHLGNKTHKVKTGESFYYEADTKHYITNPNNKEAQLLWVSSPPNF